MRREDKVSQMALVAGSLTILSNLTDKGNILMDGYDYLIIILLYKLLVPI